MSASDDREVRDAFLQAGADAVIDKRDMSGLLAAVRAVEGLRGDRLAGGRVGGENPRRDTG